MERGVDVIEDKEIYVVTGSYDVGKSATLDFLKQNFGYLVREEALKIIQQEISPEIFFHNPNEPYAENLSPTHICPRCKPKELTELILKKQLELERSCSEQITILERGFCDSIAYLKWLGIDNTVGPNIATDLFAKYRLVFLMEVMDGIQEAKWGKTKETRAKEARDINELIFREYLRHGFKVVIIPAGTIVERASLIDSLIQNRDCVPFFGIVDYSDQHDNVIAQVLDNLNKNMTSLPPLLFRVTGGHHMFKVLNHGTDRAGFTNEMRWGEDGYIGRPRKFEDIIYASTEKEILEGMAREDLSTSFKKIPVTPNPYLLVYDASKFELVHCDHQYAFRDASRKKEALLAILKIKAARE